jgi:hypothetical protein
LEILDNCWNATLPFTLDLNVVHFLKSTYILGRLEMVILLHKCIICSFLFELDIIHLDTSDNYIVINQPQSRIHKLCS